MIIKYNQNSLLIKNSFDIIMKNQEWKIMMNCQLYTKTKEQMESVQCIFVNRLMKNMKQKKQKK